MASHPVRIIRSTGNEEPVVADSVFHARMQSLGLDARVQEMLPDVVDYIAWDPKVKQVVNLGMFSSERIARMASDGKSLILIGPRDATVQFLKGGTDFKFKDEQGRVLELELREDRVHVKFGVAF